MTRSRVPNVVGASGRPKEGAKLTAVTDIDGAPLTCYTNRIGTVEIEFPIFSDAEGYYDCWAENKTAQLFFAPGEDVQHNPAVVELVSGDDIEDMLTVGDLPGLSTIENTVSPVDFGADPTGAVASNQAFEDAFHWVIRNGGVLDLGAPQLTEATMGTPPYVPTLNPAPDAPLPVYLIESPGIWDQWETSRRPFKITASNPGRVTGPTRGATMVFRGEPGDTHMCKINSMSKFIIENIAFEYEDTGFDGDLVMLNGTSNGDINDFIIRRCTFFAHGFRSARSMLWTRKAIIGEIGPKNHFSGGDHSLRIQDNSFLVGVDIHHNTYNFCNDAHIFMGSGDCENVSIHHECFEVNTAIEGGLTSKGDSANNGLYSFNYHDNWHGDKGGPGTWMEDLKSLRGPCVVANNNFASWGSSMESDCMTGFQDDWVVRENFFAGGGGTEETIFGDADDMNLVTRDNMAFGVGYLWRTAPKNFSGDLINMPSAGHSGSQGRKGSTIKGQLGVGSGGTVTATTFQPALLDTRLAFGENDTLVAAGNNQILFYYQDGHLIIQLEDGSGDEIKLMAGANPNAPLRVGMNRLGFFNTTPVTKETGVAETAAALKAALVRLGLIGA